MKLKRLIAYFIDVIIVSVLSVFILSFLPFVSFDMNAYTEKMHSYNDYILRSTTGSADIDEEELIQKSYDLEKMSQTLTILTTGMMLFYFGIVGFVFEGQTLGKKIMKIKIVAIHDEKLQPGLFLLREIILLNIIPKVLLILVTILSDVDTWYSLSNVLNNISYIFMFIVYGFIIFRDDERGLHDITGRTKVVHINDNK